MERDQEHIKSHLPPEVQQSLDFISRAVRRGEVSAAEMMDRFVWPFFSGYSSIVTGLFESLAAELEKVIAQAVNQESLSADEVYAALHPIAERLRELAGHVAD